MANSAVQNLENEINRRTEDISRAKTRSTNTKKRLKDMKQELKFKESQLQSCDEDGTMQMFSIEDDKRIKLEGSIEEYSTSIRDKKQKLEYYSSKIHDFKQKITERNDDQKMMNMLKRRNEVSKVVIPSYFFFYN